MVLANGPVKQLAFDDLPSVTNVSGFEGRTFQGFGRRYWAEEALVEFAFQLGAGGAGGALSAAESALLASQPPPGLREAVRERLVTISDLIQDGEDPLGTALCALREPAVRRRAGAIYTPVALSLPMVDWVLDQNPQRVIDAGAGSGRFACQVARRAPNVALVAVDNDPLATLITRANLTQSYAPNVRVLHDDFTTASFERCSGRTAFLGNPPYIRHHGLGASKKAWAAVAAHRLNKPISLLAGLHVYFFLATALMAEPGDIGCFVTSAEWLDVNYGSIVRQLLLDELGAAALTVISPDSQPFEDTATTAVISCFQVGCRASRIALRQVADSTHIGKLGDGPSIARERLVEAPRWTPLIRTTKRPPSGYIELGELCRVHRGAVTGSNAVWISRGNPHHLPNSVLFPSVTRARELFDAGLYLDHFDQLAHVIDLPADLSGFGGDELQAIEEFLKQAQRAGAADTYVARNRRAWWSVGLRQPAPILATYMARRPPAFVRNQVEARHINIAHGLYPREPLTDLALDNLAKALSTSVTLAEGRTYAGGLTKFEPREMERLYVPDLPELLST